MQQARKTDFALFFKLLKGHRPFGLLGTVFICLALFILLPLMITINNLVSEPYQNYDTGAIMNKGTERKAIVTNINELTNISVNGVHPKEIYYSYKADGKTITDKFQTMALSMVDTIPVGSTLKIKAYNNESVVMGLEPYAFPMVAFLGIPGVFLLLGTIFLLINLLPALKNYKLYKYGLVKDAILATMAPYSYSMSYRATVKQAVRVDYYFTGKNSQKIFGKSIIDDFSILNEKKSGDTLKIFVSPEDETKNTMVPRLEALKYNWNIPV